MLTPEQITEIVNTMYPLLDGLNAWITKDLIQRFMARMERGEANVLTETDHWQLQVYKDAGGHLEALQQQLQTFTGKSELEVKAIFEDAGIKAWTADEAFFTAHGITTAQPTTGQEEKQVLGLSESMVKTLTDTYQRTNATVRNFTRTTATASQQRLITALDTAHFKVITGAQSYTAAVKDAVNELAEQQTKVHYSTGHTDTIETAVLRAVRTGVAQASGNLSIQGMIEHDWDLIRVSAHLGARYGDGGENPGNHFWWQGKLYSRTGKTPGYPLFAETTGYGTGEGLCGWNCRHSFGPGDPNNNPFKDYDAEENKKAYDLSQKQRRMESSIRQSKRKVLGLQTAIDVADDAELKATLEADHSKAAIRLQKQNQAYAAFCKDNDLKPLSDRISIAKWSRSQAARATAAARKAAKNT